jgi:GTPase SAR1 family protein
MQADAALIMFDVGDAHTFELAKKIGKEFRAHAYGDAPIFFVMNKED